MAVSYTYTTLRDNLINTTEEQGTEFAAALDNIIALGEQRLLRDLNIEFFDAVEVGNFTPESPYVTKPTGMVAVRTMFYDDGIGNAVPIEFKSWEYCKDYWPSVGTFTLTPKYATDFNETEWFLAGTPSSSNVYTVRFLQRPAGLSSAVSTTWLSENVGDLLFYACLCSCEAFLKADDRVDLWKTEYKERLTSAKMELRRDKRDEYAPIVGTPDASSQ